MKVATKLGLGYGMVVALLALVMGGLVLSLERAADGSRQLAEASERLVLSATDQRVRLDRLQETGLKYAITRDSGYARRFDELAAAYGASLDRYRRRSATAAERRAAAELSEAWERFRDDWTPLEARLSPERPGAEADSLFAEAVAELRGANRDVTEATRAAILSSVDATESRARTSETYAWAGVGLATLLAGIVWLLLVRSISRALGRLVAGTRRVAEGDFSVRLDADRSDEFGDLADAFDRMAARLEELDQLKKDFLSKISHDLKSPLATMREVHRFLLDGGAGGLEEKQRELLRRNEQHGERLSAMITTLLDVARFEAGAAEVSREPLDLAALVEDVVAAFEPRFERSSVAIEHGSPNGEVPVQADPERVRQLLENLLDNALAASSEGDRVRIEVRRSSGEASEGDLAVLTVADEGPGVPDDEKEAIFERFFQGGDRRRGNEGTGLGLTLCRQIAAAHGGDVDVLDGEGGGAVFRVRLPTEAS